MPRRSVELIISVAAIVISFLAATLSWWQLEVARTHNRLSVKPFLVITPFLEGEKGRNGIYLSNQGLGPAILKSIKVSVNGGVYDGLGNSKWPEILRAANTNPSCYKLGWPPPNTVLKTGAEEVLLAPTAANIPICTLEAYNLIMNKNIAIAIEYESIYEEKHTVVGSSKINLEP